MKIPKTVYHVLFLFSFVGTAPAADRFKTDINPALIYYQAFALAPELSEADRRHLFATEWRGRALDARFEDLIAGYDNQFKLLRQAAQAQVPCDWGLDLSQGPDILLPGLAKSKAVAQTARLRVLWHLQHGRQSDARDDLMAAFVLGRNTGKGNLIIGVLVQFAMENIVANSIAENIFAFKPETLKELVAGLDAAPGHELLRGCMKVEKASFCDWYVAKIREFQAESPNDDAEVVAKIRALFARTLGSGGEGEQPDTGVAERVIAAAGGTSAGVLARFSELDPLYEEMTALLGLRYTEFGPASKAFEEKLAASDNPLGKTLLPALAKARAREFNIEVRLAMIHAAVECRLHGEEGLRKVIDPCGDEPFRLERVTVMGVDRGFVLKSKLNTRGFDEALVFATNVAPPLYIDGANAGKPLPGEQGQK